MVHAPSTTEKISVDSTTKKADDKIDDKPNGNNNDNIKNGDPADAGNMIAPPDQQLSRSPDFLVDAPSSKSEDDVRADAGLVQRKGVGEDTTDPSAPSSKSSAAVVNGLDNNLDEVKTNGEINYYSNHNHHVNGMVEDEENVESKAQTFETEEMDKGQYVGNGSWEEKTWKELVRLREDMFWARLGGYRG